MLVSWSAVCHTERAPDLIRERYSVRLDQHGAHLEKAWMGGLKGVCTVEQRETGAWRSMEMRLNGPPLLSLFIIRANLPQLSSLTRPFFCLYSQKAPYSFCLTPDWCFADFLLHPYDMTRSALYHLPPFSHPLLFFFFCAESTSVVTKCACMARLPFWILILITEQLFKFLAILACYLFIF